MKLTNLKITPKLGILVGVTLLGLCIAGALAGYLMQREMLNARIDQTKSMVEMVRNLAASYKLDSNFSLYGRLENAFDTRYQSPDGFLQPGIGLYAGIKANL